MNANIEGFVVEHDLDDEGRSYIHATVAVEGGQEFSFTIHQSLRYADTINVEIVGDFTAGTGLRVNLNDHLIWDSERGDPGIPEYKDRTPDLEDKG